MIFHSTPLPGAYTIDLDRKGDDRGFFARFFCKKEFQDQGLEADFLQANNSLSASRGTLRGLHYQLAPAQEVKVIRCLQGRIYDVILDLREESPTFGKWFGATLTGENRTMMYVPRGFAHAFLTLEDDCEVFYMVSANYAPELERGIRWNDPTFAIQWPIDPTTISEKDLKHPEYDPSYHQLSSLEGSVQ